MAIIKFRIRRDTSLEWARKNPLLDSGEQGLETDTGAYKIGNGRSRWLELKLYPSTESMVDAIKEAMSDVVIDDSVVGQALVAHIDSDTPHPAYDDGPSLSLLYQNAKV